MKFLSVRDLRGKSSEIWKQLPDEQDMVVTSNGRPIAILTATSESTFEESLSALRTARAIEAVGDMQRTSMEKGVDRMSLSEINREIKAVRKKRSK